MKTRGQGVKGSRGQGIELLVCVTIACAAPQAQVSRDRLDRLPRDGRAAIYDRENDLIIAWNRRDAAKSAIQNLDRELDALEERVQAASSRLRKSAPDRVSGAKRVAEAKRDYLKANLKA